MMQETSIILQKDIINQKLEHDLDIHLACFSFLSAVPPGGRDAAQIMAPGAVIIPIEASEQQYQTYSEPENVDL